jgi:hypothetical protein
MGLQPDWRWCDRCYTLAYSGFGTGACRAGGGHVFDASGAYLVMMTDEPAGTQNGWRWCANCQSLAYSGFNGGTCFAGGEHDFTGSGEYSVPMGGTPVGAQAGWRWCSRCQCLVYGGDPAGSGFCPAGSGHDLSGSSAYSVATPTTAAAEAVEPRITVEVNGGQIYVRGEGFFPMASARVRFAADGKNLDIVTPVNQAGRIQHTEDSRPYDGACVIWAHDLTTQKWAVYRLALRLPRRFPLDPVTIDPGTELDPL